MLWAAQEAIKAMALARPKRMTLLMKTEKQDNDFGGLDEVHAALRSAAIIPLCSHHSTVARSSRRRARALGSSACAATPARVVRRVHFSCSGGTPTYGVLVLAFIAASGWRAAIGTRGGTRLLNQSTCAAGL